VETIDYKVNVDVQEALSNLQMVDMTANQSMRSSAMGFRGDGAFAGFTHTQQAFGDLAFSTGQFGQRMAAPLQTFQTGVPTGMPTMPHVSFGTAATAMFAPGELMLPHGVSRYSFEAMAREQFATQVGRGIAGAAAGAAEFMVGSVGGALGAGLAGAMTGSIGGLPGMAIGMAGGIGGYMASTAALKPIFGQMEDQSLLEDVVLSTSRRFLGPEYSTDPSGRGYGRGASRRIAKGIREMGMNDPLLDTNDLANIAGVGASMGFFNAEVGSGGVSADEYLTKFKKLTADVKKVATALGTSLSEGMQTMQQLQGMGFGVGQMGGVIDSLHTMSGGDPQMMRGLIATGGMGAAMFNGSGMGRTGGFWQAIQTSGMVQGAGNAVGAEALHQAGGARAVTQMMLGSNIGFQQGGVGMMMQAGMQLGGGSMGMGLMDMMSAGGGAIGGMDANGMADFLMTRMEDVGKMSASDRIGMQRKQFEFIANSSGMTVETAAFFGLRGEYGDVRARVMAKAIARGGGGGGGAGSRRLAARSELVAEREAYMQQTSTTAVIGGWRDMVARKAATAADLFMDIGEGVASKVAKKGIGFGLGGTENASRVGGGDADVIMDIKEGKLHDVLKSTSGLTVSHYAWSESLGGQLEKMNATKSMVRTGEGIIDVGATSYSVDELERVMRQADSAADTAFNSKNYNKAGRYIGKSSDQFEKAMVRINHSIYANKEMREDVADWVRQGNVGAIANAASLDMTSGADMAVMRDIFRRSGGELRKGQIGGSDIRQAVSVAFKDLGENKQAGFAAAFGLDISGETSDLMKYGYGAVGVVGLAFAPTTFGISAGIAAAVIGSGEGYSEAQALENKAFLAAEGPELLEYAQQLAAAGRYGSVKTADGMETIASHRKAEESVRRSVIQSRLKKVEGYEEGMTLTGATAVKMSVGERRRFNEDVERLTRAHMKNLGYNETALDSESTAQVAASGFDHVNAREAVVAKMAPENQDKGRESIDKLYDGGKGAVQAGKAIAEAAELGKSGGAAKRAGASNMTTAIAMGADPTQKELVQTLLGIQRAMEAITKSLPKPPPKE
jgi:hypothetical protein